MIHFDKEIVLRCVVIYFSFQFLVFKPVQNSNFPLKQLILILSKTQNRKEIVFAKNEIFPFAYSLNYAKKAIFLFLYLKPVQDTFAFTEIDN